MKISRTFAVFAVAGTLLAAAGCASDAPGETPPSKGAGTGEQSKFFVQADYDREIALRNASPQGPSDKPWEQALDPQLADTTKYKKAGPYHLCFSNAGVGNPWRQVGIKNMQAEVALHPEIKTFTVADAESKDDKQISDINDLLGKGCDALIVSPNTTATLTPAVEQACAKVPVIVFDRGVNTKCP
ncbi:MAG TPA: ABC transporter substrate-binding protein, partial [Micromonosporaceae bacterium]|nr:ABC transporter substrate-binding protein [Micromonosporaceae bacterium]